MPRFIFIPGWAIPSESYGGFIEALSDIGQVSAVDYGFFSEKTVFDFDALSFKDFIFPEEKFIICAHSMGTLLALKYASIMNNIEALVLISPFAKFTQDENYTAQNPVKIDLMLRQLKKNPAKMLEAFYSSLSPSGNFHIEVPGTLNTEMLAAGLEFLKKTDYRGLLPSIKIPALILQGDKDAVTQKTMTDYLALFLAGCEYRIVTGCGHSLPLEKGRGCAIAVKDFLFSNNMN